MCCSCAVLQKGTRFTPGFLLEVLMSWINSRFVVAGARRQLLLHWMCTTVDDVFARSLQDALKDSVAIPTALSHLVPHDATLAELIRTAWLTLIVPTFQARNALMARLDGCVMWCD